MRNKKVIKFWKSTWVHTSTYCGTRCNFSLDRTLTGFLPCFLILTSWRIFLDHVRVWGGSDDKEKSWPRATYFRCDFGPLQCANFVSCCDVIYFMLAIDRKSWTELMTISFKWFWHWSEKLFHELWWNDVWYKSAYFDRIYLVRVSI